jgi:hypothetical protein
MLQILLKTLLTVNALEQAINVSGSGFGSETGTSFIF